MDVTNLKQKEKPSHKEDALLALYNVGPAVRDYFRLLKIESPEQLKTQDADDLYGRLCALRGERVDPCVHDVFAAAIHQVRTKEALPWWHFSAARKRGVHKD